MEGIPSSALVEVSIQTDVRAPSSQSCGIVEEANTVPKWSPSVLDSL